MAKSQEHTMLFYGDNITRSIESSEHLTVAGATDSASAFLEGKSDPTSLIFHSHGSVKRRYSHKTNSPQNNKTHMSEARSSNKMSTEQQIINSYNETGRSAKVILFASDFGGAIDARKIQEELEPGIVIITTGSSNHEASNEQSTSIISDFIKARQNDTMNIAEWFAKKSLEYPETLKYSEIFLDEAGKNSTMTIKATAPKKEVDIEALGRLGSSEDFMLRVNRYSEDKAHQNGHLTILSEPHDSISSQKLSELVEVMTSTIKTALSTRTNADLLSYRNKFIDRAILNMQDNVSGPIDESVRKRQGEILTQLMNLSKYDQGNTDLHIAAYEGNIDQLNHLISMGSGSIDAKNEIDQTPLHVAVANRKNVATDKLIQAGASINEADIDGNTPLNVASKLHDPRTIIKLLEAGANPNIVNLARESMLHNIISEQDYTIIPNLFVANKDKMQGVNLNVIDKEGLSPLDKAIDCENASAIQTLTALGAKRGTELQYIDLQARPDQESLLNSSAAEIGGALANAGMRVVSQQVEATKEPIQTPGRRSSNPKPEQHRI